MPDALQTALSSWLSDEAISLHALNDGAYGALQARIRECFLKETPQILAAIQDQVKVFVKSDHKMAARSQLSESSKLVRLLRDNARIAGFEQIARMTGAFAAFLDVLSDRAETVNASTLRTTIHTVDFLRQLFEGADRLRSLPSISPLILVIDDETSLSALVCASLQQAGLRAIALDHPADALRVLALNTFNLIFLDVAMPGMDGFAVCTKLRTLPTNTQTPVVFLTGLADFENRAHSILSGGNDLIAKPFLPTELIVKALIYIYTAQLRTVAKQ